jgi:hypothetical protein
MQTCEGNTPPELLVGTIGLEPTLKRMRTPNVKIAKISTVLDADYGGYMDIQQNINLNILRQLAAMEIDLALPDGNRATLAGGASAHEGTAARSSQHQPAH